MTAKRVRDRVVTRIGVGLALCLSMSCSGGGSATGPTGTGGTGAGGQGTEPGTGGAPGTGGTPGTSPEDLLPPAVHASKVKQLLTGLPLEDAELKAVLTDATALGGLVQKWIELPQWRGRMITFFKQAFQQTQTDINDYDEQLGRTTNPWANLDKVKFVRAAEESFALTALALIDEGAPFTQVLTTERFMLNPPLMSSYAYMDAVPIGDNAKPVPAGQWLLRKYPKLMFTRTTNPDPATGTPRPIPLEDSINPASPNFMVWYEPKPYMGQNPGCKEPDIKNGIQAIRYVGDYLYGGRPGCGSSESHFTPDDWQSWRMVTVRKPKSDAEERTLFWDVPKLRDPKTTEMVLATPRVGFMTTPAFFANWPTNTSNSYRVTTNQTLIVGLGRSFDDRGTTVQVNETSVDNMHVQPGTACFGCHSTLDPMRAFFEQSYSLSYFQQLAAVPATDKTGVFTVDDSPPVMGTGIQALAKAMAEHPYFAAAWAQKLCQFADSISCVADDPELARVADVFKKSNFNFKVLVKELFSSPLVTFARATKTSDTAGVVISIARREGLCAAIENRFKLGDPCNLRLENPTKLRNTLRNLALSVPGDGYARGDATPLLPHDPNMFFHGATENLCTVLATELVDAGMNSRYTSGKKGEAITDFTATVMGLPPSDPRSADMTGILSEHFDSAVQSGATASDALRSTFIVACASPLGISLGL